jgi:hypothetical protein
MFLRMSHVHDKSRQSPRKYPTDWRCLTVTDDKQFAFWLFRTLCEMLTFDFPSFKQVD